MVCDWKRMGQMAATVALLSGAGIVTMQPAMAQTALEQGFDIPEGPLGATVARLGQQAGMIISVDPDLVRAKQTPGLSGRFTPEVALERLLAGTGLRAQAGAGGTYNLSPLPASVRPAGWVPDAATDLSDLFRQVPVTGCAVRRPNRNLAS